MVNPIEIRTLLGVRLDVYPTATVEVNMGGISLLNLQDRTATYTNSFKMPRTKTNEAVFEFASQPTRNNRPLIDVIITKGLFQRQAVLKVVDFGKDYSCSVSYSDNAYINSLKSTTIRDIFNDYKIAEDESIQDFMGSASQLSGSAFYNLHGKDSFSIPNTEDGADTHSIAMKLSDFVDFLEIEFGITISGDLLSMSDFTNAYFTFYDSQIELVLNHSDLGIDYYDYYLKTESSVPISDIIKEIALFFFTNTEYESNNIVFNSIDLTIEGALLEGFEYEKKLYSGLQKNNFITYNTSSKIADKNSASDVVVADGTENKEMVNLKSYFPVGDGTYYDLILEGESLRDKFSICTQVNDGTQTLDLAGETKVILNSKKMAFFTLSGFYSTILNPIFANPVILEASRYFDPLTASQLMTDRVINSVQLGGRYWVDQLSYNLTTGNSKLTLIKI